MTHRCLAWSSWFGIISMADPGLQDLADLSPKHQIRMGSGPQATGFTAPLGSARKTSSTVKGGTLCFELFESSKAQEKSKASKTQLRIYARRTTSARLFTNVSLFAAKPGRFLGHHICRSRDSSCCSNQTGLGLELI